MSGCAPWVAWAAPALAVLALLLAVAMLWVGRRRGVGGRASAGAWVLLLAHPGVWMDVGVDCGWARLQSAVVFTSIVAAVGVWIAWRPVPERLPGEE